MAGGVRIWVDHERETYWDDNLGKWAPKPKGGRTVVKLLGETDEDVRSIGIATCSEVDNYSRRLGTRIALGRAQKLLRGVGSGELVLGDESQIWELAKEMARGKGRNGGN